MRRHPVDPVSAVLGLVAIAVGVAVMAGSSFDLAPGWIVAVVALMAGVALVPWEAMRGRGAGAGDDDPAADQPSWSS